MKVPGLSIKEADLNLTKRELTIGSFSTEKGEILVRRARNGDVNLLTLTPPAPAPETRPKNHPGSQRPEGNLPSLKNPGSSP